LVTINYSLVQINYLSNKRTGVIADISFTLREWMFYVSFSCDLNRDPMTLYELDPYSLEIYQMWKYELTIR